MLSTRRIALAITTVLALAASVEAANCVRLRQIGTVQPWTSRRDMTMTKKTGDTGGSGIW